MTEVVIVERLKNNRGITVSYVIQDAEGGDKRKVPASFLEDGVSYGEYNVINATLLESGGFRATGGCKIRTTVEMDIAVSKPPSGRFPSNPSKNFPDDYYGKEFVNLCRRIRLAAIQNRVEIDPVFRQHVSNAGNNLHLFKLIEACGVGVKEFLRGYLSVLQPYSLQLYSSDGGIICILDIGYRVALYIKFERRLSQDFILVSFHESNTIKRGKLIQTRGEHDYSDKLCAVLLDGVVSSELNPSRSDCKFTIQRGFIRETFEVSIPSYRVNKNVALVSYKAIEGRYQDTLDRILNELQNLYFVSQDDEEFKLSRLGSSKVSFMGFGYTTVNNVSLLLDCFMTFTDKETRKAVTEVTCNLLRETPQDVLLELKQGLVEKYSRITGYSSELYNQVLYLCDEEG